MIKITKKAEPSILSVNKGNWTKQLLGIIHKRGDYSKLTEQDKKDYVDLYNCDEVKDSLRYSLAVAKCIYCESNIVTGDLNIEHFKPKSLYPAETFQWGNLYASCILCNRPKGNYDTGKKPFVNPGLEDPEEFLSFDLFRIIPRYQEGKNKIKAEIVIKKCNLERDNLVTEYCKVYQCFYPSETRLKQAIEDTIKLRRKSAMINRLVKILGYLKNLKTMSSEQEPYAGFLRQMLRHSIPVQQANNLIKTYATDLGLPKAGFDWGWNYDIPETL